VAKLTTTSGKIEPAGRIIPDIPLLRWLEMERDGEPKNNYEGA
jgi:hypothetical protein